MLEQLHQPWPWQTQSRACPRETQMQKENKNKAKKNNQPQKHHRSLKTPSGICQAKSQWSSAASLGNTEPQQVTFPLPPFLGRGAGGVGWGTHLCIAWCKKQWTALSSQQGLRFRPPQEGTGCAGAGLRHPGGCVGALDHICQPPGPCRQPASTSCLCFSAEHTPSGLCQR